MAKNNHPLGLDPKKMRVESVDKNFTTLRHQDGHQIRIAHNILSPENRKALAAFGKSTTETMTPVQAQEAQESNKANMYNKAKGGAIQQMPRGMTYADGGSVDESRVPVPSSTQPDTTNDPRQRISQVQQGASQSGGMNAIPSAEELANRLKNWWAEGGEVTPHNMPDNVTGYAKGGKVDDESELVHYSPHSGLTSLDPEKMGTSGVRGAQYKRGVPENKSTFFYTKNSEPESEVTSRASAKYHAKLGPEHKIYDLSKDPDKAMQHVRDSNQGAFNEDMLHAHLKSQGYHGVKWEQRPGTKVVQMYSPMNVTEEAEGGKVEYEKPELAKEGIKEIEKKMPNDEQKKKSEDFFKKAHEELKTVKLNAGGGIGMMAKGGKIQKKEIFGSQSSPSNPEMREKHIEHIRGFAKKLLGIDVSPSGGKINPKTGERRDENPEVGVDKPDWRSGKLEAQWNPDAIVHELAHLLIMPKGIGLKEGQKRMDKQYADVQKNYGYMKQKQSQGEIQPMAVENILRRMMGLPAAKQSTPVAKGQGPRMAVDTGTPAAIRVPKGEDKEVDLIRQARLLSPENRQRVHEVISGKLKFHPEYGWQENPEAMGAKSRLYKEEQASRAQQGQPPMNMPIAAAEGGEVAHYDEGTPDGVINPSDIGNVAGITGQPANSSDQPLTASDVPRNQYSQEMSSDKMDDTVADMLGLPHGTSKAKMFGHIVGESMVPILQGMRGAVRGVKAGAQAVGEAGGEMMNAVNSGVPAPQDPNMVSLPPSSNDTATVTGVDSGAPKTEPPPPQPAQVQPQAQAAPQEPQVTNGVPQQQMGQPQANQPIRLSARAQAIYNMMTPDQQQKFMTSYQNNLPAMVQHQVDLENDRANQHISPKTYNDLMYYNQDGSEKSTLGKIGSIFKQLVGGAGAGLARQEDLGFKMMDNVIARDLDAQKTSKANAQNFLNYNQHVLQSGIYKGMNAQDAQIAYTMGRVQMNSAKLSKIVEVTDEIGRTHGYNSPEYQHAKQLLGLLYQRTNNDNYNLMDSQAVNSAYFDTLGINGADNSSEGQFQQQQRQRMMLGPQGEEMAKYYDARHLPGINGTATREITPAEQDKFRAMTVLDDKVNDVLNFANRYRGFTPLMWMSQEGREAQKQGRQKAEELTSFYNKSVDSLGMTQGRLGWLEDQVKKNPQSIIQKFLGNDATLREIRDSNRNRRDLLLHGPGGLGFPKPQGPQSQSGAAPEGQIKRLPNGQRQIKRNGVWENI